MRKQILVLLWLALTNSVAFPQFKEPGWMYVVDGFNVCDISDLEVDQEGNTFAAVNYTGALNLIGNNGRPLSPGKHMSGVLIKLDRYGKLVWSRGLESAFDNRIYDLTLDSSGNVYITGFGDGQMNFPGKSDNYLVGKKKQEQDFHEPQGLFLAKYSANGDRMWVNFWNSNWAEGRSISVNSKGEVVLSYLHYNSLFADEKMIDQFQRTPELQAKVSLAFFDANGKLNKIVPWKMIETNANLTCPLLRHDHKDNLYCFGQFKRSLILSPQDSLTNDGYYDSEDAYLVKFDSLHQVIWKRQWGGQNIQALTDIDIAADGSVYGSGFYSYECIFMDEIKSSQIKKDDHRAGNSLLYFHLFEDGELDFIRYEEGKRYDDNFAGTSIDLDINGRVHIVGNFTDTLQFESHVIESPKYPASSFSSEWKGDSLVQLSKIGQAEESWLLCTRVRSSKEAYAMGAIYYGSDVQLKINGKNEKLGFADYGRASVILGGMVAPEIVDSTMYADQRESRRLRRLKSVEPLFACTSKRIQELPSTWYPTLSENSTIDSLTLNDNSCGVDIKNLEALLFPNPTNGPATIRLKGMEGEMTQIDIYSERGQLMYSQRVLVPTDEYDVVFDMGDSAAGIYIVRIRHGNFEKALRLVKMKI